MKGEVPKPGLLAYLGNLSLFHDLQSSSLELLASACRFRQVNKGEILFLPCDPAESVYVVCAGTVLLVLNSADGRELVIDEVHAGELFGELEVLTRKARSVGAVAHSACDLLIIPSRPFLKILSDESRLAQRLLELTANRLESSVLRQAALAFMNAHARLARNLLRLDDEQREAGYVTVSQDELANGAGLIRQTVAKALGEWRRNGWLLTGRGRIVVLNRKALEKVARAGFD
jgi:CRP/FNR family cyclic AMP-dependent transcriptional regulator